MVIAMPVLLVNGVETALSESFPAIWTLLLGALFIGAVLLFPHGLVGVASEVWRRRVRAAPAAPAEDQAAPRMVAEMQQE
jgi:urea transport system permease protein